jgi:predicted HD superfamily hydrolase involved in NAD metabolism
MMMQFEQMMATVEAQLPEKRWKHTLGVIESSVELAKRFGADPDKARIAALLHDIAKYWPAQRQREAVEADGHPAGLDTLQYDKPLWHSHAGAYVARTEFGIEDEEILDAIRYHTSGRIGMTLLEKVVCLADYIEPGRDYPGVEELRKLAETSLERALLAGFDGTIMHLIETGKRIYPLTVLSRNDLLQSGGL